MLIPHVNADTTRAPWAALESQVYTLALADVTLYQRALLVARAVADGLKSVTTVDQLVAQWAQGPSVAAAAASARGVEVDDMLLPSVAAAGYSLRASEIKASARPAGG